MSEPDGQAPLRLADERSLAQLLHDYCRGLDSMDLDLVASAFSDECRVDYGPSDDMQIVGRDALKRWLGMMRQWKRTAHHLSNIQIWFDSDDQAHGVSYVLAWHELPDGTSMTLYGQYHDRFVRTGAGWRIGHRQLLMSGSTPNWQIANFRLERAPRPNDGAPGPPAGTH